MPKTGRFAAQGAIVTRDGSTNLLDHAGIPATQLEKLP